MSYRVREGDSLSGIAALHGVEVRHIIAANPHKPRATLASGVQVFRTLAEGEELVVPAALGAPVVPDATPIPPHAFCDTGGVYHLGRCYYPSQNDTSVDVPQCELGYAWDLSSKTCLPDGSQPPPDPGPARHDDPLPPGAQCPGDSLYDHAEGLCIFPMGDPGVPPVPPVCQDPLRWDAPTRTCDGNGRVVKPATVPDPSPPAAPATNYVPWIAGGIALLGIAASSWLLLRRDREGRRSRAPRRSAGR